MPGVTRLVLQHLFLRDDVAAEAADAEARPVERERRDDGVDARAIRQARVDDGLRFIDAAADLRNDLFDDVQQVRVVLEADLGLGELAVALDEDFVVAVDQDIADARLFEQRLQRAESEHFVEHLFDDLGLLGGGHGHALFVEQAFDDAADLGANAVLGNGGGALQIEDADQLAMDLRLQLEVAVGDAVGGGDAPPRAWTGRLGSHYFSRGRIRLQLYPEAKIYE